MWSLAMGGASRNVTQGGDGVVRPGGAFRGAAD